MIIIITRPRKSLDVARVDSTANAKSAFYMGVAVAIQIHTAKKCMPNGCISLVRNLQGLDGRFCFFTIQSIHYCPRGCGSSFQAQSSVCYWALSRVTSILWSYFYLCSEAALFQSCRRAPFRGKFQKVDAPFYLRSAMALTLTLKPNNSPHGAGIWSRAKNSHARGADGWWRKFQQLLSTRVGKNLARAKNVFAQVSNFHIIKNRNWGCFVAFQISLIK